MPDDTFEMTVKLTRGTEASDRDTQKVKVSAGTIDELDERVDELREKLEVWADDWRAIQPDGRSASLGEDQQRLGEGRGDA